MAELGVVDIGRRHPLDHRSLPVELASAASLFGYSAAGCLRSGALMRAGFLFFSDWRSPTRPGRKRLGYAPCGVAAGLAGTPLVCSLLLIAASFLAVGVLHVFGPGISTLKLQERCR
jgi:hypothetical protein